VSEHTDDGHSAVGDTAQRAPGNSSTGDVRLSFRRWLVKNLRNPYVVFTSLVQPVVFFVLFAEVFGAVADGALVRAVGPDVSYVTFLTPAVIVMSTLASAATSGIGLVDDMETGMFQKMLVSPMDRSAMFVGKLLSEVARIVVQTLLILLLGYLLVVLESGTSFDQYIRTGVVGVAGVVVVAVIFGGVFIAYSNVVALVSRDQEATIMFTNLLTFPLLFVSSAFVPLSALPGWIETVAVLNPITYGVDAIRAIVLGRDVTTVFAVTAFGGHWNTVVPAVTVLVVFAVVVSTAAVRLLGHTTSADVR
jgi:ABC-2 type transport system permease protein